MTKVVRNILIVVVCLFAFLGYQVWIGLQDIKHIGFMSHRLDHEDIVISSSSVSPDGEYIYYEYQFDHGGFGFSRTFWSVIENDSSNTDLDVGRIPMGMEPLGWEAPHELLVKTESEPKDALDSSLWNVDYINDVHLILKTDP